MRFTTQNIFAGARARIAMPSTSSSMTRYVLRREPTEDDPHQWTVRWGSRSDGVCTFDSTELGTYRTQKEAKIAKKRMESYD